MHRSEPEPGKSGKPGPPSRSESRLSIPLSVPILGEAFIGVGSPMVTAALDFMVDVRVVWEGGPLSVPVSSSPLRRSLARYLSSKGIGGIFTVEPVSGPFPGLDHDYLAATAVLHAAGAGGDDASLLSQDRDKDFIVIARALTSLSGGFVVSRVGEGAVSLEGVLDASVLLRISPGRKIRDTFDEFSRSFPELADPLWHLAGHLAIEGGRAVGGNDAAVLGRLLRIEGALLYALGLASPACLRRVSLPSSYGGKVICSEGVGGELILAPDETLTPPGYSKLHFNTAGVRVTDIG